MNHISLKIGVDVKYQLRLDVQHFLWPAYYNIIYTGPLSCIFGCKV